MKEGSAVRYRLKTSLLALLAVLLPTLAEAHAILEESTPPSGTSVKSGMLDLRLRFNSRIDRGRSRLMLIRADRSKETVPIATSGPPEVVSAHLNLTPGVYVVRWQVLATDGHITRGDVPITVTAP
jgi:methionine-rich copper-binding protein CopC